MKSTGVVRKIDSLGRIVLPMEIRRSLKIGERDSIEIFVEGDKIILRKFVSQNTCLLTGKIADDNISLRNGKIILSRESAKEILSELHNELIQKV
ncbi:AbrB/MazE/SpoVT family DNA-binding domain-containing protein [Heyndrickxia oleronia]|uniref:AbrB/MazE/SpoVT family DNA-binding domain-containing protein n=1 Tax=Heyndrickxia oleronia TaxID=38875 RepID=A0AAW6T422_9BACI|nr:AbrB/MazE/SpoVT family DNA-binding domain-containing protein [Heyndrickxia oleronia]MCM3240767.1 AbrB/MazE/SpoVT family DNA-binding domain-containing protein [Heyndrickxia oleronia]MCM3454832.1 AbrB/MazE/SpoVT family DNA-binding domain-containing protein [Heyndrickxia oleronia]MDH5163429.1 AbrB/MazE/SpoVT family DNA-binding domain-containing protein [Heyndrickxia oleronia]NYV66603.1 AbrB/MazE/SpoVT family DNA-binding domain-containing protein [Bacillus sp. Gen3]